MKRIIAVNILIIFLILLAVDVKLFKSTLHDQYMGAVDDIGYSYFYKTDFREQMRRGSHYPDKFFAIKDMTSQSTKPPILLIGCSYTYGHRLELDEGLYGELYKLTKRPIYNLGSGGMDAGYTQMLLERAIDEHQLPRKPEYIIYTYMFHHIWRVSNWFRSYFNYQRQIGNIPDQKYNPLYRWFTWTYFKNRQLEDKFFDDWNYKLQSEIFFNVIKSIKTLCNKTYPDAKFVVLIYNDVNYDLSQNIWNSVKDNNYKMQKLFDIMESAEFKKRLEDMGITVITTESLIGRKMDRPEDRIPEDPDGPHPSASAWADIVPKLVERLKL